jgi:MFS transporter, FSR family, fosmidomycin resistance protein
MLAEDRRSDGQNQKMTAAAAQNSAATAFTYRVRTLATCCATHALHDGLSNLLYLLFPIWQAEFALSLTQVGLLKTSYSGAMASFQIPASLLAERLGERGLLAVGTACTAVGFAFSSLAVGFVGLALCLVAAGLGSSVQHPLNSTLIARAYEGPHLRAALGTYNFAGDVGKAVVPALLALIIVAWGWRDALGMLGIFGVLSALAILYALGRFCGPTAPATATANRTMTGPAQLQRRAFAALSTIGVIDSGVRTAFLTFLPFLLTEKGISVPVLGVALGLVFTGGALGKFVCGLITSRVGVLRTVIITECGTAVGILLIVVVPAVAALALMPLIGIALNGTSTVLYGTVPELVPLARRARAFGVFYTLTIGSGALAPALCGALSDALGLHGMVLMIAGMVLLVLPLTLPLRGVLKSD